MSESPADNAILSLKIPVAPAKISQSRGRNISLSDYEMRLLVRLCRNNDEAVSREELNLLLGAESGNIADVYICRLRKKLEEGDGKRVIFTVRSKGYRISSDIEWK